MNRSARIAGAIGFAIAPIYFLSAHPAGVDESHSADWSQVDFSWLGLNKAYTKTRAVCAAVIDAEPPVSDLPTAKDREALEGCRSEYLYFGIGVPADPEAARKCAFLEMERIEEFGHPFEFFHANGMLATIYANGKGAERNLDFAIHSACQLQDAPMAMDLRIRHLDRLRREGVTAEEFSTCDHITSGISMGICASHNAALRKQSRQAFFGEWAKGFSPEQRQLFAEAYASFEEYVAISHEMDCFRGSAFAACTIEGAEGDTDEFVDRLVALAARELVPSPKPAIEGDVTRSSFWWRPATMTRSEFQEATSYMDESDRDWYEGNLEEAIAARRQFEPKLIAFLRSIRPDLTAHQIRVLFRDI